MNTPPITSASVKVMRSHDYCHFEVCLSTSDATTEEIDALRKAAARLADKAVEQYKIAKVNQESVSSLEDKYYLSLAEKKPEEERSPSDKARIKFSQDESFRRQHHYDYEDDYEIADYGDES